MTIKDQLNRDFICVECGQEYDELGDGKCYACGGEVIPIDKVGQDPQEPEEYPSDVMEDEETEKEEIPPEELEDEENIP